MKIKKEYFIEFLIKTVKAQFIKKKDYIFHILFFIKIKLFFLQFIGTSYTIGTILPQEAGNCLQCICIEAVIIGDPPRVTCSPHNCPPLILPDLFDATGY